MFWELEKYYNMIIMLSAFVADLMSPDNASFLESGLLDYVGSPFHDPGGGHKYTGTT